LGLLSRAAAGTAPRHPRDGPCEVRLDQPRGADVEAALGARHPIVPAIAVDHGSAAQLGLDLEHRCEKARIVVREEAREADPQGRGVDLLVAVRHRVGTGRFVPAVLEHVGANAIP